MTLPQPPSRPALGHAKHTPATPPATTLQILKGLGAMMCDPPRSLHTIPQRANMRTTSHPKAQRPQLRM